MPSTRKASDEQEVDTLSIGETHTRECAIVNKQGQLCMVHMGKQGSEEFTQALWVHFGVLTVCHQLDNVVAIQCVAKFVVVVVATVGTEQYRQVMRLCVPRYLTHGEPRGP